MTIAPEDKPGLGTLAIVIPLFVAGSLYQAWLMSLIAAWYFVGITWTHCVGACSLWALLARGLTPKQPERTFVEVIALVIDSPIKASLIFGCMWLVKTAFGWFQ